MALNTVTLTWDLSDFLQVGIPESCTIHLTPSSILADTTDSLIIPALQRSVTFTGGTGSRVGIVANDNPSLVPAGSVYDISVIDNSTGQGLLSFSAAINHANGATQDLSYLYENQAYDAPTFFQYVTQSSLAGLVAEYTAPQLGTCQSVQLFGADPTGATASDAAFASAVQTCVGSASPLTTTRGAKGYVYIPAGTYRLTQDWSIRSVLGLVVKGDSKTGSVLMAHGTGFTTAVVNADGTLFCTFQDFSIAGDGTEGAGSTSTPIPWAMQNTKVTATHTPTSQNTFERIWIQPFNWQGGFWQGAPATTANQVDGNTIRDVLVQGGGTATSTYTTKWLYGFEVGNGTYGNQLDYVFYNCSMSGTQSGMWCNAAGFEWYGGEPAANAVDFLMQVAAQTSIEGIQSENSGRFISQTAGAGFAAPVAVRDCQYLSNVTASDGKWVNVNAQAKSWVFENVQCLCLNETPIMYFNGVSTVEVVTLINVSQNNTFAAGVVTTQGGPVAAINYMQISTSGVVAATTTQMPGISPSQATFFSANGTWTKPAGAAVVEVAMVGAGGGGGSGAYAASGAAGGGGAGGGGGYSSGKYAASQLPGTVSVAVGAGGAGGAAKITASAGAVGVAGGASIFGAYLWANGGGPGAAGNATNAAVAAGGVGGAGQATGGAGGSSVTGAAAGGTTGNAVTGGGGAGGGVVAGPTAEAGGFSLATLLGSTAFVGNGGVVGGTSPTAGASPIQGSTSPGGGGGAGATTGAAQNGATAVATSGGGGGGGGACTGGTTSGAGGTGGSGWVLVITYF